MKINKILVIIQTSLMYLSLSLLYLPIILLFNKNYDTVSDGKKIVFIIGFVIGIITALLAVSILIPSIISIFKKNNEDMTKLTMIIKLISIPWYIANYVFWVLIITGSLNPFLFIAIPFIIAISVINTYIYMLSISMNNICVLISELKNKNIKVKPLLIVGMVFQFIFCLDVLGAIFTYVEYKKQIVTSN